MEQPAPPPFREKETTDGEEEKPGKTEPEDTVPEETPERIQQRAPCPAGRERERHTGIVHSTQTVMVGATLKMQLAENCLRTTDSASAREHRCSGR